jgi:energy-coupling factor transporter ATP-binding protein EcfA2
MEGRDVAPLRPYERNVGLLFQDYALFPHMTVAENVGYGFALSQYDSSWKGEPDRSDARTGQNSRVSSHGCRFSLAGVSSSVFALARALAINPRLVLLDEPLSALDAKLRHELRTEIKEILARVGATTIIVTHDQEEAPWHRGTGHRNESRRNCAGGVSDRNLFAPGQPLRRRVHRAIEYAGRQPLPARMQTNARFPARVLNSRAGRPYELGNGLGLHPAGADRSVFDAEASDRAAKTLPKCSDRDSD